MEVAWQRRMHIGRPKLHSSHVRFVQYRYSRRQSLRCYAGNNEIKSDITPGKGWRSFWSAVDTGAWLGALGSAAAFVATQEALLIAGPLIFPIIALYANKEKSVIDERWSQARIEREFSSAVRQLVALSEEGTAEVAEEVAAALTALESKSGDVTFVEKLDKILPIVEKLEDAVKERDDKVSSSIRRSTDAVGEGLKKLRNDVRSDLQDATTEEVAALSRLDSRIAALEGAINGLDSAQADSFRRLTANLSSTLSIEEDAISSAVKAEVWKSLEPVRQLPQILSQTLPRLAPTDQSYEPSLTEESAKKIFAIELENLKNSMMNEQRDLLEELSSWTTKIDSNQWNQLGAKLEELDEKLTKIEGYSDMTNQNNSNDFLNEIKDDFRSLSRDLEEIGSQMTMIQASGPSNAALQSGMPEMLQSELEKRFEDSLTIFCQRLKDRADDDVFDSKDIAKELSQIVVSTVISVLQDQYLASVDNTMQEKDSESIDTGVPIASWLSEQSLEKVPIKQSEEILFERSVPEEQRAAEPPTSVETEETANASEDRISIEDTSEQEESQEEVQVSGYQRGLELLKNGRDAFEEGEYELADTLLAEADVCFDDMIKNDAGDIKSIGNRGNTLMARAKAKLMMANTKFEQGRNGAEDDEQQALEMLIQAGRLYRQILEVDPAQGKAFVNWGRVVCLRAEISQSAEDFEGAYSLFCNAADKFTAGIDVLGNDNAVSEAYRLAGTALVGAYYCASTIGLEGDAFSLLLEAEDYLSEAGENDSLVRYKLDECRELIARAE